MNDRTGYILTFSTPNSDCRVEADSLDELIRIVPNYVGEVLSKSLIPRVNIYEKATKIHQDYNRRFPLSGKRYARSTVARAGHELDVIVCYLLGWTAYETVQWLKKHRSFVIIVHHHVGYVVSTIGVHFKMTGPSSRLS